MTEDIILEAITADALLLSMESNIETDRAILPMLKPEGARTTVDRIGKKTVRVEQLRLLDIYRVEQQLADQGKVSNDEKEISLYQLYQIAEKEGIFDAVARHSEGTVKTPLL